MRRDLDPVAETAWASADDAERYERGRPDYPPAAVEIILRALGLGPASRVADVAAGTGKLTRAVAGSIGQIVAIEPSAGMRSVLRREVPAAEVLDGTAEALPLGAGSVDGVVVGTAFHWFDGAAALREFARVLRPGGGLALVWNEAPWDDLLWWHAAREVLDRHLGSNDDQGGGRYTSMRWRVPLDAPDSPFGPVAVEHVDSSDERTAGEIAELIESWSRVSVLGADERELLLAAVRESLGPGLLEVPRRTSVWHTLLK